jgi:hypothetical protein
MFPIESFRERLSRQFGADAVALSGPCEGQSLVDCIVNQLDRRWDRIKSRFAGNHDKAFKLAVKIGESFMRKDDTDKCIADLEKAGYKKNAAAGIAEYLKAYAMDTAADMEIETAVDEVENDDVPGDDLAGLADDGMDAAPFPAEEAPPEGELSMEGEPEPEPEMGLDMEEATEPMDAAGENGDTISIDLPVEVAQELHDAIMPALDIVPGNEPHDLGEPPMEDAGGEPMDMVLEIDVGDEGLPGGDLHGDDGVEEIVENDEVVPGEPESENDGGKQFVEGGEEETAGMACAGEHEECSHDKKADGAGDGCPCPDEHESMEKGIFEKLDKGVEKLKKEHKGDEEEKAMYASLRQGRIKKVASGDILKLGPEMSINNTDQQGGHDDKKLGNAKEKSPEDPKPISEGNLSVEGHSAGDNKFQDGKTMGHEETFDAKEFDKASSTGGEKSIMGKDESYPEGKPQVPAGSAPIGGEVWNGGDLSTKGTVIATITPKGVLVEANGKKFLAKAEIKPQMVKSLAAALAKIAFEGDGKKYAQAAYKAIKEAEKSGVVDGVTTTDTSKLEGEKFTNDGEKKPAEGGAMTGKGKGCDYQNEGVTKTDTSKLEGEKFTNDGEKKPEKDAAKRGTAKTAQMPNPQVQQFINDVKAGKMTIDQVPPQFKDEVQAAVGQPQDSAIPPPAAPAAGAMQGALANSAKGTRTADMKNYNKPVEHAGDKAVEDPKALDQSNIKPEGHMAGGKDVHGSDGSVMGHEEKFKAEEVSKSDVAKGDASLLGKDESVPKDGPKVPVGGGQMGHEEFKGDNVSTKGTTIAEDQSQKRTASAEELQAKLNAALIEKQRTLAASVYVADLLRHGEITEAEFAKELEKTAAMSVPAIQNLIASTKKSRERVAARAAATAGSKEVKVAGLTVPIVMTQSMQEKSLKDRLTENFKLTKTLDALDEMK